MLEKDCFINILIIILSNYKNLLFSTYGTCRGWAIYNSEIKFSLKTDTIRTEHLSNGFHDMLHSGSFR